MDDEKIVELFEQRSEEALRETEAKYGRYLRSVAQRILDDEEDSRECVNDALLAAWNAIPPARPQMLQTFLGRIVRNLALDRWRGQTAQKRGGGAVAQALEELPQLAERMTASDSMAEDMALSQAIKVFLRGLRETDRSVFMKRYWHFMTEREIADDMGLSRVNVRVILHRCRSKLKEQLEKEGFGI